MPLIYVEFRSRRPSAELRLFHGVTARTKQTWSENYPEDTELLNIARTWRLGPEPEYLTIYYSPRSGLERLDEWETIFGTGDVSYIESSANLAFRIDRAGCYTPLLEPTPGNGGPYYVEYFSTEDLSEPDLTALFEERKATITSSKLHLAAAPIGTLAPAPGGLAIWSLPTYEALGEIRESILGHDSPANVTEAGVYVDIGREIL